MIPAAFVRLDQLPLTPGGKVDRRSLPAPGADRPHLEQEYVEPRTPTEQKLASVFQEVLGIGLVGNRDDFFELGGDSLTALQVVSRIGDAFGIDFPVSAVFEKPCIEALAPRIDSDTYEQANLSTPPLVPVPRNRPLPVSFVQERLWFLYELDPASDAYNMPAAVRVRGNLDVNALERALNDVIARHESLRTSYEFREELVQLVAPRTWVPLRMETAVESQLSRLVTEGARATFDLGKGPLLKTRLFRVNERDHVLLVVMHHSIWDGWSLGIFFKELEAFYCAAVAGELKPDLPKLPVQYGDFAFWQRRWMQGPLLEKHLWFWKNHLAGAPAKVQLPPPATRLPRVGASAERCSVVFDDKMLNRVSAFAHRQRATPFMVLLTGLAITLQKWTAQNDLVIGTVVAGRPRRELEDLIGCFINFLPLRINVGGIETAEGLLQAVRQTVIEAQSHQDCPFEKIVSAVNPRRVQGGNPLYNVALLWHQFPINGYFSSPELKVTPVPVHPRGALLDLRLEAEAHEGKWIVQCEYNTVAVEQKAAQELLATLTRSVDLLARAPQSSLSEFTYAKSKSGGWLRRWLS
jgi:acyl carrier protein